MNERDEHLIRSTARHAELVATLEGMIELGDVVAKSDLPIAKVWGRAVKLAREVLGKEDKP